MTKLTNFGHFLQGNYYAYYAVNVFSLDIMKTCIFLNKVFCVFIFAFLKLRHQDKTWTNKVWFFSSFFIKLCLG